MTIARLQALTRGTFESLIGVPWSRAEELARNAERLYRERDLEVHGKQRTLKVPLPALADLQRRIHRRLLRDLRYLPCVYCCRGRGLIRAATAHRGHPAFLQLDIKSFFPSVRPERVKMALQESGAGATSRLLTRLVTVDHQLPQGASTSVAIGNLVLRRLDRRLSGLARKHGLTYTRYVDDLGFSGGHRLQKLGKTIKRIIKDDGWKISRTGYAEQASRHQYLGIVFNTSLNADPRYLDDLRYTLARMKRERVSPTPDEILVLRGKIGWVNALNPRRGASLIRRLEALLR